MSSTPLPGTMRAVRIHEFGGPDVLRHESDVPLPPAPGPGQVLLRVGAAGVGYWDGEVRRGEWQDMITYSLPLILGTDVSGIVAAVGEDVGDLEPGSDVFGVADMTLSGSNAEYALARAAALAPRPSSLPREQAGGVGVGASTGLELVRAADPQPGQRILVVGAGGTVGAWALQWLADHDVEITATASGPDLDWVRDHGATRVLDHHAQDLDAVPGGFDTVIDAVPGPEVALRAMNALEPGGRLLVCAAPVEVLQRADTRRLDIRFVSYVDTAAQFAHIAAEIDAGRVHVRLSEVLPLEEAATAHRMLDGAPHPPGKLVLHVADLPSVPAMRG